MQREKYNLLVNRAMLSIVKIALEEAASGAEINLFITFDTESKGVVLSNELKSKYPQQMSIVLQHQFNDLKVLQNLFSVALTFSGRLEYLKIPFNSLIYFLDRECNFALEFNPCDDYDDNLQKDNIETKQSAKILDISSMIKNK